MEEMEEVTIFVSSDIKDEPKDTMGEEYKCDKTVRIKIKRFKCDKCHYKTSDNATLRKHMSAVHEGIKYPCDFCQYKASAKDNLKKHLIGMHSETKFECDKCDYRTNFQSSLISHKQAIHKAQGKLGGSKLPYVCNKCGKESKSKSKIKIHVEQVHDKLKGFKCDKCDYEATAKKYVERHSLKKHMLGSHFKANHYTTFENRAFQHKQAKDKGSVKFKCDQCNFYAFSRSNLIQHKKCKHEHEVHLNVNLPHTKIFFIPDQKCDSQIKKENFETI